MRKEASIKRPPAQLIVDRIISVCMFIFLFAVIYIFARCFFLGYGKTETYAHKFQIKLHYHSEGYLPVGTTKTGFVNQNFGAAEDLST